MGFLGTGVTLLVEAGGTHAEATRLCWGCLGLASCRHRPLLLAGVAVGTQGLRLPLTLSVIAVRRDS